MMDGGLRIDQRVFWKFGSLYLCKNQIDFRITQTRVLIYCVTRSDIGPNQNLIYKLLFETCFE